MKIQVSVVTDIRKKKNISNKHNNKKTHDIIVLMPMVQNCACISKL